MKKTSPFFSIGVTSFDRNTLLKETLKSIIRQNYKDFEVLVSNDNPKRKISNSSLKILDSRVKFINQPENLGERRNMNYMLSLSKGRYFTWLADDDLYNPQFLEAVYNSIIKYNFPSCIFTSYKTGNNILQRKKQLKIKSELFTGSEYLKKYLSRSIKTQGCYGIFEKQYLSRIGGMIKLGNGISAGYKDLPGNVYYPYADNWLVIQAGLREKIVFIDSPLILYRIHQGSISLTSTDLAGYFSAQQDLCKKCLKVFKSRKLRLNFQLYFFLLLKWCAKDFAAVVRRSDQIRMKQIIEYLHFFMKYMTYLKKPSLYWQMLRILSSLSINTILTIGKKKLLMPK